MWCVEETDHREQQVAMVSTRSRGSAVYAKQDATPPEENMSVCGILGDTLLSFNTNTAHTDKILILSTVLLVALRA